MGAGLVAAREAVNEASRMVVNVGRRFFGNAIGFWRSGGSNNNGEGGRQKNLIMFKPLHYLLNISTFLQLRRINSSHLF